METWEEESGIPVTTALSEDDLALPPDVAIAVLGIVREALTNVGKHSSATHVWVDAQRGPDGLALAVRDDGRGFAADRPAGHGRRIMRDRANSANIGLTIESRPGQGTEVRVRYPRP